MALELTATGQQQHFLQSLHYIAPAVVLAYFLITTAISACTLQSLKACRAGPRKILVSLASLVVLSFLVESCMLLTDTAVNGARHSSTDSNVSTFHRIYKAERQSSHILFADHKADQIYVLFSLLVWTILTTSLVNAKNLAVWYPFYGSWFIELVAEAILFTLVLTHGISPSGFAYIQVAVQACRMLILVLLSTVLFTKSSKMIDADEESASLLGQGKGESDVTQASIGKSAYGSITITSNGDGADLEYETERLEKDRKRKATLEKRLQAEKNWFTYGLPSTLGSHFALPSIPEYTGLLQNST